MHPHTTFDEVRRDLRMIDTTSILKDFEVSPRTWRHWTATGKVPRTALYALWSLTPQAKMERERSLVTEIRYWYRRAVDAEDRCAANSARYMPPWAIAGQRAHAANAATYDASALL